MLVKLSIFCSCEERDTTFVNVSYCLQGTSVEVKTFSEIMAEKRLKRQQEKELQQQNKGQGQKEENGSEESARKRKFRYQPVLFSGDGVGEELHVCVGVGMKRLSERESSTTSLFCSVMMMEVRNCLSVWKWM